MTEITYEAKLTPQQEANQAHYELAKAVRDLLPKFCKDPEKFAPLAESEAAIAELRGASRLHRGASLRTTG